MTTHVIVNGNCGFRGYTPLHLLPKCSGHEPSTMSSVTVAFLSREMQLVVLLDIFRVTRAVWHIRKLFCKIDIDCLNYVLSCTKGPFDIYPTVSKGCNVVYAFSDVDQINV